MSDEPDKKVLEIEAKKGESLEKILEEKYGIVLKHVEQIKKYNKILNWIVMLRPINKEVASKLKSGARGKIMSIKGKSSEFIFLAGDIPFEAGLSKLGKNGKDSDWDKIIHFNSVNEKSIENSNGNKKVEEYRDNIEKCNGEIEERERKIKEHKQKIEEYKQEIEERKQQIEEFESKINKIKELGKEDLLPKFQQQLTKAKQELETKQQELETKQQELETKQQELTAEQQTLERYIQEFNLSFKLNKIQKTVEINGETYECFYKVGENERPEYENNKKLGIQPVIYIKDKKDNYFKVKYGGSGRGWNIDKNNPQQIDTKSIKKLKIFSYEQYEKCAVDGENRIRVDDTTKDVFEVAEYYKTKNEPKQFFVKAKKEGDKEFKYYPLTKTGTLAGQNNITTYKINSKFNISFGVAIEKLETTYEVINPPLTADYDQLSAARVYGDKEKVSNCNLTNLESVVKYLQEEQKKLISFPADKYLEECKNAAKRLSDNKGESYKNIDEDINLLSEVSEVMAQIKQHDSLTEEGKKKIVQESDILQLKLGLLGVCGKSVTKNTMKLGSILDYGISHGLEILHYPPEPIKLRHVDNESDEEFLVIDGEGNPRVAKNLEGVLFFMNDQRNNGICCLEPNPLWPIKINLDKSPHEIQVDENSNSPLLINGFYTGIVELQKKLGTESFADEFIYAERLMLNSDFVPRIELPEGIEIKDVRKEIEANNLIEAYEYYEYALEDLKSLKEKVKEKKYDENFIKFCQEQNLSGYLETKDVVLGIFRKEKVKEYFKNNVESLAKNFDNIEQLNIDEDIKNDVTKILMNDKIKGMLLSKPDNYDLKAKIFDILPNINLLKGFEIKKEEKGKESKNFLKCLDDYIELVQNRQLQINERVKKIDIIKQDKKETKIINLINKKTGKRITNVNRRIKFLKEERRRFKDKRNLYDKKLEEIKVKRKKVVNTKNYWQQKISNERKNHKKSIKQL